MQRAAPEARNGCWTHTWEADLSWQGEAVPPYWVSPELIRDQLEIDSV